MDALFPPGPRKRLLLGNSVEFRHDPFGAMIDAARSYGEIVHFRFGPSHAYLVSSAEHIHYVLVERPDLFDAQHHLYRAIQSAFGHELFAPVDGVYKRQQPPRLLPQNWLEAHATTITGYVLEAISDWQDGQVIDLYQKLRELTLQIAANAVFGSDVNSTIRQLAANALQSHILRDRRFESPWALRLPTGDRVLNSVANLIRQQANSEATTALSLLKQTTLSERQIAEELVRLFVLIHETAATTIAWALHLLSRHPESAESLHAERNKVLGNENLAAEHLPQLVYTEMVLHETMRLYPPAWLITRQSRREARLIFPACGQHGSVQSLCHASQPPKLCRAGKVHARTLHRRIRKAASPLRLRAVWGIRASRTGDPDERDEAATGDNGKTIPFCS